jgi:hypothetical protein
MSAFEVDFTTIKTFFFSFSGSFEIENVLSSRHFEIAAKEDNKNMFIGFMTCLLLYRNSADPCDFNKRPQQHNQLQLSSLLFD